jgi:hypothetical protein
VPALLITFHSTAAYSGPQFDETRRFVLPSKAATTILNYYFADGDWAADEWPVSSQDPRHLEVALATTLRKAGFDKKSRKLQSYHRQYMPARWQDRHLIIVNGYSETGRPYNVDGRHRRADGVNRLFNVLGLPLHDANARIFVGST